MPIGGVGIVLVLAAAMLLVAQARASEDEARALQAANGSAERDGTRLTIHLTSAKAKVLNDGPSCNDEATKANSCYGYEFDRYDRARGLFVVRQLYYEGGDHILVDDRTGEETRLQSAPSFSPHGDIAVELVYGESHYYTGNPALNVWRRVGGKFVREWSMPIVDDGQYEILGWASNESVDIREVTRLGSVWPNGETILDDAGVRVLSIAKNGTWRASTKKFVPEPE